MDNNAKIDEFMSITGLSRDRASFYLEANAWNVEAATGSYFEDQDEPEILEPETDNSASAATDSTETRRQTRSMRQAATGVHTLRNVAELSSDSVSDEDGDQPQAFYAGGSDQSGQQILGPPRRGARRGDDIVKEMFRAARDHGAEEVSADSDPASGSTSRQRMTFVGTGYRLGETDGDSVAVRGASSAATAHVSRPRTVKLRLWRTGFSVDDGDLREFSDPANQQFLQDIKSGHVPRELLQSAAGQEVHLDMEDHRHEDFVKPKPQLKSFSGTGHKLGSPTPNVTVDTPARDVSQCESAASESVSVDTSSPVTRIQVRLDDGQRLSVSLNHHHTVAQLRTYITTARPEYSGTNFALRTTFPSRELTDNSQTVKDAQLINAVVMVRRLN